MKTLCKICKLLRAIAVDDTCKRCYKSDFQKKKLEEFRALNNKLKRDKIVHMQRLEKLFKSRGVR